MGTKQEIHYDYHSLRQLPMVVGMLAPFCVLLSIPPITGNWESDDFISNVRNFQDDPIILILLIVGLTCLFFGNVSLLFRFLERHVVLTTWLSILGYSLNFCFTLTAVLYFRFKYIREAGKSFSGEYYAAYVSCIISLLISLFLMIDFFKNNNLKGRGSGLSRNQRLLVFMAILVTIWAVLGALMYGTFQGWTFTRGIYFVLVTTTTIGFGDYVPKSVGAQMFCIFYAAFGIILMGMFIAFIRTVILEYFENAYNQKLEKLGIIRLENLTNSSFQLTSDEKRTMTNSSDLPDKKPKRPMTTAEQQEELKRSQIAQYLRQLRFSSLAVLLFWFLGAAIFSFVEDWDYFKAFYFCFISFTTIGYGDLTVTTFQGVVIFCVYVLIGLVTMAYFISVATELFSCIIDSNSDVVERKRKVKTSSKEDLRQSRVNSHVGDPGRNLALVEVLEQDTGDEEKDLIYKLLTMTEFYHQEVSHFVKNIAEDEEHYHINEDEKNSLLFQKLDRYEKIYGRLISLCKKKLTSKEVSTIELEVPPSIHKSPLRKSESTMKLLQ